MIRYWMADNLGGYQNGITGLFYQKQRHNSFNFKAKYEENR